MTERIVLIDYGSGNLRSAAKALERVSAESGRAPRIEVSGDVAAVAAADRIVLPGVGAFGQCSAALRAIPDMVATLRRRVIEAGRPFLGVCVGMQLMADRGLEHGVHAGLGWVGGDVVPLAPGEPALKVPHMGWNRLTFDASAHPLLAQLPAGGHAYFVHSYRFAVADPAHVLATTRHGEPIAAIIGRDTMIGTQFHPEKSQAVGLALLAAFLAWRP